MSAAGVHARWTWVCHVRRRISLPVLNAILKLTVYVKICGCFPPHEELQHQFETIRDARTSLIRDLRLNGIIAPALHHNWEYRERFNLQEMGVDLVRRALNPAPGLPANADVAWGQYLRFMFKQNAMYRCSLLSNTYFYIVENKSLPGRLMPGEGEALVRGIVLALSGFLKKI